MSSPLRNHVLHGVFSLLPWTFFPKNSSFLYHLVLSIWSEQVWLTIIMKNETTVKVCVVFVTHRVSLAWGFYVNHQVLKYVLYDFSCTYEWLTCFRWNIPCPQWWLKSELSFLKYFLLQAFIHTPRTCQALTYFFQVYSYTNTCCGGNADISSLVTFQAHIHHGKANLE